MQKTHPLTISMRSGLKGAAALLVLGMQGIAAAADTPILLTPVGNQPADCAALLDPAAATGRNLAWTDTVAIEHCDRIKRLWLLTAQAGAAGEQPRFFETRIPASKLPPDVPVDVPLLRVVFPDRVFFDTGLSQMLPAARRVTDIVAASLRNEPPDVAVFIAGHTDARGGRDYNQDLSVARANAVADAILGEGVNVARVWRVGFGEDFPIAPNDTPEHLGLNRRVEFLFAGKEVAVLQYLARIGDSVCSGVEPAARRQCLHQITISPTGRGYTAVELGASKVAVGLQQAPPANVQLKQAPVTIVLAPIRTVTINPDIHKIGIIKEVSREPPQ
ncbi:MAG: OmpA family protein [Gammaproteobacteria bacterium]